MTLKTHNRLKFYKELQDVLPQFAVIKSLFQSPEPLIISIVAQETDFELQAFHPPHKTLIRDLVMDRYTLHHPAPEPMEATAHFYVLQPGKVVMVDYYQLPVGYRPEYMIRRAMTVKDGAEKLLTSVLWPTKETA